MRAILDHCSGGRETSFPVGGRSFVAQRLYNNATNYLADIKRQYASLLGIFQPMRDR